MIGFGLKWEGGDMRSRGGGFKVNLLRKALEPYRNNSQQIIIFTDRYVIREDKRTEIAFNTAFTIVSVVFM